MAAVTVVFGGEKIGEHPVGKSVVIGRGGDCDIVIDNLAVSRQHCQIVQRGSTFILQDTNSASGTYVNGRRVVEHYLNDGDQILIGKHALVFEAGRTVVPPSRKKTEHHADVSLPERTYVMDAKQIRSRLAESQGAPGGQPLDQAPTEPAPGLPPGRGVPPAQGLPHSPGLPGAGPMKAMDHAAGFDPLRPRTGPTRQVPPGRGATRHVPARPSDGIRAFLYLSLVTNVVLIALIVVLILLVTGVIKPVQ